VLNAAAAPSIGVATVSLEEYLSFVRRAFWYFSAAEYRIEPEMSILFLVERIK
jgi:hypothetical protein